MRVYKNVCGSMDICKHLVNKRDEVLERADKMSMCKFLSGTFKRYTIYDKHSLSQHLVFFESASPRMSPPNNVQNQKFLNIFHVEATSEMIPVLC